MKEQTKTCKYLGALVDTDIYNKFKAMAAIRGESMQNAITNAALVYLDVCKDSDLKLTDVSDMSLDDTLDRRLG